MAKLKRIRLATRRQFLAASMALGAAVTAIAASPDVADSTPIHMEVDYTAGPARVYEALLDEQQFSTMSGAVAQIQRQAGGAFSLFGGRVTGRTVELIPNQRIVQAWRAGIWPAGVYSIVRFELTANGSGPRVLFDQTNFPSRGTENAGWSSRYWDPLRKYLDK